ncbi:MAG: 16S rRNA processing protein RimM [Clostridiaceae bacterium]|jgi:16S rRNA processing protein RimM|nr:16S rRNA processing protein RimM [Clostridiaceae bacterium]
MRQPYLIIARVKRAHGVRGEVYADILTDDDERFYPGLQVFLFSHERIGNQRPVGKLTIEQVRYGPSGLLLFFEECDSREEAAKYSGLYLAVRREDALPLRDETEFYVGELLGASVYDDVRGFLGVIASVDTIGSSTVIAVRDPGKRDLYIPFREIYFRQIDIDADRIDVTLPPDLYGLYRGENNEKET